MAKTLSEILIHANAMLDLEASEPTGQELTLRANFADRAVWDAAATSQLNEFKRVYETSVSASTLATISLPSDYREMQDTPRIKVNGSWEEYEQIKPEQKYDKSDSDYYCYVLGSPENYNLIINQPQAGTLSTVYQRFPSGLATLTDVCELTDPLYVSTKVEAYVLQGRGDDRFPIVDAQAEQKLANMVGRGQKMPGGGKNRTPVPRNPLS